MRLAQAVTVVLISAGTVVAPKWGLERLVIHELTAPSAGTVGPSTDFDFADYGYGVGRTAGGTGRVADGRYGHAADGRFGHAAGGPVDFVNAVRLAIPATVHVTAKWHSRSDWSDLEASSGSGAILSADGYIVTNNHVLQGADQVSVTLSNRKTLPAKVIGTDPVSDLAVLKVDAAGLPFLLYGNSDELKVGQWVLAIGYPLGLQVTATAGIISGKGRSIDLRGKEGETYLQTDAAVNLGNSGGPLVNPAGQIVGINCAIASPNGAYTGYSFAIPVNTVNRVVTELIRHGMVSR